MNIEPVVFILGALLLLILPITLVLASRWHASRLQLVEQKERLSARESELEQLNGRLLEARTEAQQLQASLNETSEALTSLKTESGLDKKHFEDKLKLVSESREQLSHQFKALANEIFDNKTRQFKEQSSESLTTILAPLQQRIREFEKKVEDTYDRESKERFSLAREIRSLQELNDRISKDAVNLTNALKGDNKIQGNWGELVLESVLERSGLVKGREYEVQVSLKDEEGGRQQPDVVVHLPESRDIIIDSKVSLKAWDAYCSSDHDDEREQHIKAHVQSLRSHVRLLSAKDYQNLEGLNSLDYVFLFMPIEAAYSTAIEQDPELFQYAFEQNIVFVVPTTLLATLKTVQNLWRLAQQNQNAKEIAVRAGALYDKFVAFSNDLEEIGARIESSRKSYEKAHNKLVSGRGNLVRRVEQLKTLGARTAKQQSLTNLEAAGAIDNESDLNEPESLAADSAEQDGEQADDAGTRH